MSSIGNRTKWLFYPLLIAGGILLSVSAASAQAPTMIWLKDLDLGMVITNTTTTVAPTAAGAGSFEVQVPAYPARPRLSVTFTLPTALSDGVNTLGITFGRNSAAVSQTSSVAGATTFNPATGYSVNLPRNRAVTRYFWIGGTVNPPNGQAAGTYTGTITATMTVTVGTQVYTASQVINVTVVVIRGLTLTVNGALDFGQVVAGTPPPTLSAQTNPAAPEFITAGNRNRPVTVTYSATTLLSDGYGNTLTFTPSVYGSSNSANQASSTTVASGSTVTLRGTGTGYYYFWLGGSITPTPIPYAQPAGSYNGTFTLTVNY